ncbi:porphobilinogen deaminase [Puccinia graminis f. sp. tritici]|uniref:Porphobilinogen deaminase n=2 Tax=Puccinia graminis f. sp. tritici TaxID=56615 RepID=E3KGG0_PUCGT|nr:uncharacterized protein PGTG_08571 [Puccinia graminis f. sp. tritici CRL 75-36-700-3]EFP83385.1 hypothetical protein PGTG_08571 [Puccinia graminis f. sp. tritici CRL 75-36-700-3]KAA1078179.1 porphobilinogen deaminase [Puccinia graminis f. sp. tritici]
MDQQNLQPTLESYPDLPHQPQRTHATSPSSGPKGSTRLIDLELRELSSSGNKSGLEINSTLSLTDNLIIGTRNSKLALVQAESVEREINKRFSSDQIKTEIKSMSTSGDENLLKPLYLLGGKSVWTKELEFNLLNGSIDLIVHSLKDVPTSLPAGCELASVMLREDPRDALIIRNGLPFTNLSQLPAGSIIGTSSVRRVAQLRRRFPNLAFQDIRGNLQTRFKKLDASDSPYTGIILAVAGLKRIGLAERITSYLEPPDLYHAVGQGAIGIEIRTPPEIKLNETVEETILRERATTVRRLVKSLEDWRTALSCEAERALLRRLEGGCSVPVGVTSSLVDLPMPCPWAPKARLTLTGVVTSVDGLEEVRKEAWLDVCGPKDAAHLGTALADELFRDGADKILDQLNSVKKLDLEEGAASESTSGSSNPSRIATLESQSHFVIAAPANSSRTDIGSNQDHVVF